MKKILIALIISIIFFIGCENTMNTPTSKVEEFLGKYQKMDKDVLEELDNAIKKDNNMSEEQQKEYKAILEKQYQNLSYKIKNEIIVKDSATVDVEIEVLDYATSITKSKKYYLEHPEEFNDDNNADLMDKLEEKIDEAKGYIDYKISELKEVTDKAKYELTFNLTKEDGVWTIDNLSEDDLKKIHGLY